MSKRDDRLQDQRGQVPNRTPDPELFKQLIQNQAQELTVRREENEIKKKELEYSFEHAQRVLEAQLEDRERERQHDNKSQVRGFWLSVLFIVLLTAGIGYALYLNKDQLVIELTKYIGLFLAGGVSGYGLRTIKEKKDDPNK
jgi:hypothetical protein